jgi:hypothetical protein
MYPRKVIGRGILMLCALMLAGCTTASLADRPECSDEAMAGWEIPASWYIRELTPEQAFDQVATGNLGLDAVRGRWRKLRESWREGDRFWRYRRPEDHLIHSVGWQEGVVLNRGCDQVGFVVTSVQVEEAESKPRLDK